jgi:membrane fusion protein (multidrug efflux system)
MHMHPNPLARPRLPSRTLTLGRNALLATSIGLASTSCNPKAAPPPPALAEVQVVTPTQRDVPLTREWVGQARGMADVEVRARVPGWIETMQFEEGRDVKKDQLLYTIDARELKERLSSAKSNLASVQAVHTNAKTDVDRLRPLAEMNAISKRDLDAAVAKEEAARNQVDAAGASVGLAELNLSYADVRAPIDGLIGLSQAKVGDFVGQFPSPIVLNTVSRIDPIHVRFSITEADYLVLARKFGSTGESGERKPDDRLELVLSDGSVHKHRGRVNTAAREIDPTTGSLTLEAEFPNPEKLVRPGQFARIRASIETRTGALLVPQRAVQELQGIHQVYVVGAGESVEIRAVELGRRVGDLWMVEKGLKPGDRVVVEGLQKVRGGVKVVAKPMAASAGEPAAPSPGESSEPATPPAQPDAPNSKSAGH